MSPIICRRITAASLMPDKLATFLHHEHADSRACRYWLQHRPPRGQGADRRVGSVRARQPEGYVQSGVGLDGSEQLRTT
ncbi:MAG: hypothetical protein WCK17_17050 [Verrucomicrobiota bacterium]|jgi:hypothetical protein